MLGTHPRESRCSRVFGNPGKTLALVYEILLLSTQAMWNCLWTIPMIHKRKTIFCRALRFLHMWIGISNNWWDRYRSDILGFMASYFLKAGLHILLSYSANKYKSVNTALEQSELEICYIPYLWFGPINYSLPSVNSFDTAVFQ